MKLKALLLMLVLAAASLRIVYSQGTGPFTCPATIGSSCGVVLLCGCGCGCSMHTCMENTGKHPCGRP